MYVDTYIHVCIFTPMNTCMQSYESSGDCNRSQDLRIIQRSVIVSFIVDGHTFPLKEYH